jgi:inosose dehydratase
MMQRRNLLRAALIGILPFSSRVEADQDTFHLATNTYPWDMFAKREGHRLTSHTSDELLAQVASTGLNGLEPIINAPAELDGLAARLKKHGLEMRSLYVNSTLHEAEQASQSVTDVLTIARPAAELGAKIIVTNPSPIRWGGPENKTDEQLKTQARALNRLGQELKKLGLTLAYHNHDSELRLGAREFHHMLTATDPSVVSFCLDAHWVYRGCGDSQVAVFDAIEHYGDRIIELHLRQSVSGVWSETFSGTGDLDYVRLAAWLKSRSRRPHLVLEQAVETASAKTMDAVKAHRENVTAAKAVFAG